MYMKRLTIALRHFFTNMVCGLIYSQDARKRVRAALNSPLVGLLVLIKKDCGLKHIKYKIITGFRGRNLLIRVNDKYIYKYPTKKCNFAPNIEVRERDITRELAKVSPIYIPVPVLLKYQDKIVRRYDVVDGISLRQLIQKKKMYEKYKKYLAHQVAHFLYVIARYNPKSLYKYKDNASKKPGLMCGWHHCDLLDNFMIDKKTFRIVAFIDWEEVGFGDFSNMFVDKNPVLDDFMKTVKQEYAKIYKK
mgnify:CR=1 FL=1